MRSSKSEKVTKLIAEALFILECIGIPIKDKTERAKERMAMAFLAVANVKEKWMEATSEHFSKTRDIINFINQYFEEKISSGSYDDIRRKDLKLLVLAGLVLNSADNSNAATNDPTRGYCLEETFMKLVKSYGTNEWDKNLAQYLKTHTSLKEQLVRKRNFDKVFVTLPNKVEIALSTGEHNRLQKLIVEEFIPRFAKNAQILYIGDTTNKGLYLQKDSLDAIHFFELSHEALPDIIAYEPAKNWLFLIEAVHSSGSISETRLFELKKLTQQCTAEIIYVTAVLSKSEFRKWVSDIAWETEVWVADNPDHLIHFNGDKFLGPYKTD